jgi:two-component system chemotaxis sensor kinase CheA
LQKLGATIDIDSKVGFGSRFTVKLPLTLAIIRGLLVTVQECVYALPLTAVVETLKISSDIVHVVNHREVILQRGKTLPIVRLRDVFRLPSVSQALVFSSLSEPARRSLLLGEEPAENDFANSCMVTDHAVIQNSETTPEPDALYIVVVGIAEKQVGLVVDSLIGEQEVVIKTLGKFIGDVRGISGATILGDGRVALIADINGIIHIATEERVRAYAA